MNEDVDREGEITRACWQAVLAGRKPSSLFSLTWDVTEQDLEEARRRGLEIVLTGSALRAEVNHPKKTVVVAQPEKFASLISEEVLERFRKLGLGERVEKVLDELGSRSIARAMAYLNEYPRNDEEYAIEKSNLERPEVAVLTGLGFGYPACDVEYYVRIRYLGEPCTTEQEHPVYGYLLCPSHVEHT